MSAENHVINYDKSVKDLTATFQQHEASVELIVKKYKDLNTQLSSLPSDFITKLREITKANDDMVKSQQRVSKATEDANRARLREIEMQIKREKAVDNFNKAEARSQQLMARSESLYNKIQAKVNGMTKAYNDLAAKKQLGLDLNAKEERTLLLMETRLKKYGDVLKTIDANIGKHQRNVGNYASGWDGLGNSINQITREMPAFANSIQTGFMALSNNIPMLADEIKRVSDNVKTMRAEGKQVPGVMSQILSSFLSWQTALSVGVMILTVYGKEIVEWTTKIIKGNEALDKGKVSVKAYNEAFKSTELEDASQKIVKVGQAIEMARKGMISKTEAVKVYNENLGDTLGTVSNLDQAEANYNSKKDAFMEAMKQKAMVTYAFAEASKISIQMMEISAKKTDEYLKWYEKAALFIADPFAYKENKEKRVKALKSELKAEYDTLINAGSDAAKKYQDIIDKFSIKDSLFGGSKSSEGTTNKSSSSLDENAKTLIKERIQAEYELQKVILERQRDEAKFAEDNETYLARKIQLANLDYENKSRLADLEITDAEVLKNTKEKYLQENLKTLEEITREELELIQKRTDAESESAKKFLATRLTALNKVLEAIEQASKKEQEATNKRREQFKDYATSGFSFGSMGFGSLDIFQDADFMKDFFKSMEDSSVKSAEKAAAAMRMFGAIANDVFAKLQASSQAYFENQLNALEKQYEIELKYAGENTDAKTALEEKYNARKLELKRQQAKQEKEMAIFQALINVATGITAALAQGGIAGFILAALVGAMGAVQIASISSQPLPQFYKGTMNAPEGWAIVDELRPEVHTDKDGNIKSTGSKGGANLRYLEKGDKIYKSHADFFKEMDDATRFGGITVEKNDSFDYSQFDEIIGKHIAKIQQNSINLDERGFTKYQGKRNSRSRILNKKVRFGK